MRVALYSPGMVGLGHVRRNLLIAQALACSPLRPAMLLLAEAREAAAFRLPPGTDMLTLPALRKTPDGHCHPRRLHVAVEQLIRLRANVIRSALVEFAPDVLIVDHLARGALGELDLALEALHLRGRTRCVLGLRDIVEHPEIVRAEWSGTRWVDTIRALYDAVWVYGDPLVFDPVREYRLPSDVAAKVRCIGYLDQCVRLRPATARSTGVPAPVLAGQRLVLCLVGGGQDGEALAEAFARADLPPRTMGVILTGPFMPPGVRERLRATARGRPHLKILEFEPEPTLLLRHADRVVAMGGYNTVCEVLSYAKPALIVPRDGGRREQVIRAQRLRDLGLVDVVNPADLHPRVLTSWLQQPAHRPRVRGRIDLHGLDSVVFLLRGLIQTDSRRTRAVPKREARA